MSVIRSTDQSLFPSINTMLDNLFAESPGFYNAISQGTTVPAINVVETEEDYILEVAAPGKLKEDLKIELNKNILLISTENKDKNESVQKNYTRKEYSYTSFSRSFELPDNIDSEGIKATYDDGILSITVPKGEHTTYQLANQFLLINEYY